MRRGWAPPGRAAAAAGEGSGAGPGRCSPGAAGVPLRPPAGRAAGSLSGPGCLRAGFRPALLPHAACGPAAGAGGGGASVPRPPGKGRLPRTVRGLVNLHVLLLAPGGSRLSVLACCGRRGAQVNGE